MTPTRITHALATLLCSCTVVAPPPLMMRHDDPVPEPGQTTRVLVFVGLGGGVWVNEGLGIGVRASHQVHRDVEVGGQAAVGFPLKRDTERREAANIPGALYYLGAFSRTNPGSVPWLSVDAGLGLVATSRGMVGLTMDSGASFGYGFGVGGNKAERAARVLVYGGPVVALTLPVIPGDPILKTGTVMMSHGPEPEAVSVTEAIRIPTTFFIGLTAGVGAESATGLSMGSTVEASLLYGFSSGDRATLCGLTLGTGGASRQ